MDIEFHYYMTYLIAAKAGFVPPQAEIIAHSAQSVDDNHIKYIISGASTEQPYENYISQTMDILKPAKTLYRIYPIFHFIPGDPNATSARRTDGRTDLWVTTPDGAVANKMIDAAIASENLYRIGASAHGYADTWAHQNFLGKSSDFNNLPAEGYIDIDNLLNVGHGAFGHQPDIPSLIWTDARLVGSQVNNRDRFLDAAAALFRKFARYIDPARTPSSIETGVAELRLDLQVMIGPMDPLYGSSSQARISRYREFARTSIYGATELPLYDEYAWFNAAVNEAGATLRQTIDQFLDITDDYVDQTTKIPCNWGDPKQYQATDWYKFVEAVKEHQNECWQFLVEANLPGLDAVKM